MADKIVFLYFKQTQFNLRHTMNTYVKNLKVLYVDDESSLLSSFNSLMWREGIQIHTLVDSTSIGSILEREGPFALVISDQRMPGLDGVGTLERVQQLHPETVRVLMTGYANLEDTQRAINLAGISRYISKPWDDDVLKRVVHECIAQYNLAGENKHLADQLTLQNKTLADLLDGTVGQAVRLLTHLISYINPHASNQTERVRKLGRAVLEMIPDISPEEHWSVLRALDLFNLGIAVLPPWIQTTLNKDGLSAIARFPAARNHHLTAAELIKDIPRFEPVAQIIRFQHKDFNGLGEPALEQISGKNIPLGARLLHILIDLDAQSTEHFRGKDVLLQMQRHTQKYDQELIALMLGKAVETKGQYRIASVKADQLAEGMIVLDDILTEDRQLLLRAQSVITAAALRLLGQWNQFDHIQEPVEVKIPI
jgi:response regulator RpfG family c-di-GMP phosphodiesterase